MELRWEPHMIWKLHILCCGNSSVPPHPHSKSRTTTQLPAPPWCLQVITPPPWCLQVITQVFTSLILWGKDSKYLFFTTDATSSLAYVTFNTSRTMSFKSRPNIQLQGEGKTNVVSYFTPKERVLDKHWMRHSMSGRRNPQSDLLRLQWMLASL